MSQVRDRDHNSFPAWASVKNIALSNLQATSSTGFESGEDDKSSFLWIKLKRGYSQEMPMSHSCPISSWQLAGSSEGVSNC